MGNVVNFIIIFKIPFSLLYLTVFLYYINNYNRYTFL